MSKLNGFIGGWFAMAENMMALFGMTIAVVLLLVLSSPIVIFALLILGAAKLIDVISQRSNCYGYLKDKLLENRESCSCGMGGR